MRVGILDHPSNYAFPPHGYGAQEKWFWSVAVGAKRSGADVVLVGPDWRDDLPYGFGRLPIRLEDADARGVKRFKQQKFDLLVIGHEYTSLPAWRSRFDDLDSEVSAFQHRPDYSPANGAFDGASRRLYVFTPEMEKLYSASSPGRTNGVCFADSEESVPKVQPGDGTLVWASKLHPSKAPHIAAMAAAMLKRHIYFYGPIWDAEYLRRHRSAFATPFVHFMGEIVGQAKLQAFVKASCLVYSCHRDYVEAGSAFFSDPLRCGLPVAAQVWRRGTAASTALSSDTGFVEIVDPSADDHLAASGLAACIEQAMELDRGQVQEAGLIRFDPVTQFHDLASRG